MGMHALYKLGGVSSRSTSNLAEAAQRQYSQRKKRSGRASWRESAVGEARRARWGSGRHDGTHKWRPQAHADHHHHHHHHHQHQHAAENGYMHAAFSPGTTTATSPPYRPPAETLTQILEAHIEKVIFNCRFLTLLAVVGSLSGSMLCFIQGCRFVTASFLEYIQTTLHGIETSHVVVLLIEAIDIFLVATVMLIFGMGIYELFVNAIGLQKKNDAKVPKSNYTGSNLFGLFRLEERPLWLEIRSIHELKTKVGHVIVMILLVGMFEKSKTVPISTGFDLLCFAASIFTSSGCLFLLSKLHLK